MHSSVCTYIYAYMRMHMFVLVYRFDSEPQRIYNDKCICNAYFYICISNVGLFIGFL